LRVENTDGLANKLHFEAQINGSNMTFAQTFDNYGDGINYTMSSIGPEALKPHDKVKYKVYTRRNNQFSFLAGGTLYVNGWSFASTAFQLNYGQGNWT
jgi:phosphosulfolactate synthase (CoM biosynthesis protein A)